MEDCQIPETHDYGAIVLMEIPHDFGTLRYIQGNQSSSWVLGIMGDMANENKIMIVKIHAWCKENTC